MPMRIYSFEFSYCGAHDPRTAEDLNPSSRVAKHHLNRSSHSTTTFYQDDSSFVLCCSLVRVTFLSLMLNAPGTLSDIHLILWCILGVRPHLAIESGSAHPSLSAKHSTLIKWSIQAAYFPGVFHTYVATFRGSSTQFLGLWGNMNPTHKDLLRLKAPVMEGGVGVVAARSNKYLLIYLVWHT